jgi:ATP-dependent RNA helicase DOB1
VWEETIILLPDAVRFVFLSATIPNAFEFAQWIAKIHRQPCHVVYTEYRPTPLQHYVFPAGGKGLHLVVDERGKFRADNFERAVSVLSQAHAQVASATAEGGATRAHSSTTASKRRVALDAYKIVKMIMERQYEPVIVFAFSKRECERLALQMAKLDFNDDDEKALLERVFNNAVASLSDDDQQLPQVQRILPLLKRGIGIHHSGLLPILKEVIEILFQEGLIKALFATETFSMGLNMPAKTVVFTSVRKFDGRDFRWVRSGEYIQMSGRAGRRGLDDRGIVILMVDEKMEPSVAKGMLRGAPDRLHSEFHLGYNMLLNLLRVEDVDVDYLIRRSFHQHQQEAKLPAVKAKLRDIERRIAAARIDDEPDVAAYYELKRQLERLKAEVRAIVCRAEHMVPFLQPGRLVHVVDRSNQCDYGWCVALSHSMPANHQRGGAASSSSLSDNVLMRALVWHRRVDGNFAPAQPDNEGARFSSLPVRLNLIEALSSVRVFVPQDPRRAESARAVAAGLAEIKRRFGGGAAIPLLDPLRDMDVQDVRLVQSVDRIGQIEQRLLACRCVAADDLALRYALYEQKLAMRVEARSLGADVRSASKTIFADHLKGMKRVLRRLGYTNAENIIQLKGRVACEINAADELVLTELMFTGVFNELEFNQIAALVSCLVVQDKSDSKVQLSESLAGPLRQLQQTARRIAQVSQESKINVNVEQYVERFQPTLMDVVFAWCNGSSFLDICTMTDIFEGSIIRCMRRLEELLRQLSNAAKAIGNGALEAKFAMAISAIKRDIIFAASLYL